MPNYKIFQDYADALRIRIYGADESGSVQPILTSTSGSLATTISGQTVGVSGTVGTSGSVAVSGPVEISGMVGVSGNVGVSGTVGVSGSVAVSGPVEISGMVGVSGNVGVSGTVGVSGSVAVSGPVEISGMVGVSGNVGVSGTVGVSGSVAISGHSVVDSGPVQTTINSGAAGESGTAGGGSYDILSYSSWTLAVKYSGASGDQVTVNLQTSALSGTAATDSDYVLDSTKTFANGSWNLFTTGLGARYARLYYVDTGAASGTLLTYFQAQN